jgi:hypothetical protein
MVRRVSGSVFYFVERPCHTSAVLEWFRNLQNCPEEFESERGYTLFFRNLGALQSKEDGSVDHRRSPLVSFFPPRVCRGVLTTVGEVHFLTAPQGSIRGYDAICSSFRRWLGQHEIVYEQLPKPQGDFAYYLEGSIMNIAPVLYALPSGLEELMSGRYFIAEGDSHRDLLALCQKLRLRGVDCC